MTRFPPHLGLLVSEPTQMNAQIALVRLHQNILRIKQPSNRVSHLQSIINFIIIAVAVQYCLLFISMTLSMDVFIVEMKNIINYKIKMKNGLTLDEILVAVGYLLYYVTKLVISLTLGIFNKNYVKSYKIN